MTMLDLKGVFISQEHQIALGKMSLALSTSVDKLVDKALEEFLQRHSPKLRSRMNDKDSHDLIDFLAGEFKIPRDKLIDDVLRMTPEKFTKRYPVTASSPNGLLRLREYIKSGGE